MTNEKYKGLLKRSICIFFVLVFVLVFIYVWDNYYNQLLPHPFENKGNWLIWLSYAIEMVAFQRIYGGFKIGYLGKWNVMFSQILAQSITNCVMTVQIVLMVGNVHVLGDIFGATCIVVMLDSIISIVFCWIFSRLFEKIFPARKLLLIYGEYRPDNMINKMHCRHDKYRIDGMVSCHMEDEFLEVVIKKYKAVFIYDIPAERRNDILKLCHRFDIEVYMTSKISDVILRGAGEILLFDTPLLYSGKMGLSLEQRFLKRVEDVMISLLVLTITLPVMIITALCIWMYDRGPIFYCQERCTLGGKVFKIYKFRSMVVNAEKDGKARLASRNDSRITPVGNIIRKTRLDELPQLINILKGDMSIVGPRPERPEIIKEYEREIPEFALRLKIKGGLTGYAQVYGKYNTTAYDKLKLDLMYIEKYSLLLDIKLILMTIKVMFMKTSTEGFEKHENMDN